jgi:hypothetical protein
MSKLTHDCFQWRVFIVILMELKLLWQRTFPQPHVLHRWVSSRFHVIHSWAILRIYAALDHIKFFINKINIKIQWNLDLSFPDNSFSWILRSISMAPERILFQLWLPHLLFPRIHRFFFILPTKTMNRGFTVHGKVNPVEKRKNNRRVGDWKSQGSEGHFIWGGGGHNFVRPSPGFTHSPFS